MLIAKRINVTMRSKNVGGRVIHLHICVIRAADDLNFAVRQNAQEWPNVWVGSVV